MKRQELRPEIAEAHLTPLSQDEFDREVELALQELDGGELDNLVALIAWFKRRYPTPAARLAYNRSRYPSWARRGRLRPGERE